MKHCRSPLVLAYLLALVLISVKSQYPTGYTYAYGDLAYLLTNYTNKTGWFSDTFVDYDQGNLNHLYVSAYYYLFSLLQDIVGVEYISIFYSGFFLIGSFFSFMLAVRLYNIRDIGNKNERIIYSISLLYAVNAYTSYGRFSLPSLFFSLYTIVPLLFATIHSYFVTHSVFNRKVLYCAAVLLISNYAWLNPSYFVAYGILSLTYILLLWSCYRQYTLKQLINKLILFYFVLTSSCLVLILPITPILIGHTNNPDFAGNSDALIKWIASQAVSMERVFSLGEMGLNNVSQLTYSLLKVAACLIFMVYGISLIMSLKSIRRTMALFSILILVMVILLNKGKGTPLESMVYTLFSSNSLLASLRSYDKVLIFFPFFLLLPFSLYCISVRNITLPLAAMLISLVCLYPLLNGDLFKRYYRVENGSTYLNSASAPLVKIPQEYFDLTSMLNYWEADNKIIDTPWNLLNPDFKGWSHYPEWKLFGVSPAIQYFKQPVVLMNSGNYFNGWKYGLEWNEASKEASDWMLWLAGCLDGRYILYHKDVSKPFIRQTASKIGRYVENEDLTLLVSNRFFQFYKLSDDYILPHIYVPNKFYYVNKWEDIPEALKSPPRGARVAIFDNAIAFGEFESGSSTPILEYRKNSSARYTIRLHNVTHSFPLVFSEGHNGNWRLYPKRYTNTMIIDLHDQKPLETGDFDQARVSDVEEYVRNGWISDLGNGDNRIKTTNTWVSFNNQVTTKRSYNIDFVSREIKGTIQNNNLPDGHFYDTWTTKSINDKYHGIVNGYANYWYIDLPYLLRYYPGILNGNQDDGYDFELIIEFWPQKLLYISRIYTSLFACTIIILLVCLNFRFRRKRPPL